MRKVCCNPKLRKQIKTNLAQIQGQVIIYILAVIIASFILLYGYGAIKNLVLTQEDILIVAFKEDVKSEVAKKSYEFRNINLIKYQIPKNFDEVCAVDLKKLQDAEVLSATSSNTLIQDSIRDGVKRNIFLVDDNIMKDGFYAGNLAPVNGFDCIEVYSGEVSLKYEALGKEGVKISG